MEAAINSRLSGLKHDWYQLQFLHLPIMVYLTRDYDGHPRHQAKFHLGHELTVSLFSYLGMARVRSWLVEGEHGCERHVGDCKGSSGGAHTPPPGQARTAWLDFCAEHGQRSAKGDRVGVALTGFLLRSHIIHVVALLFDS